MSEGIPKQAKNVAEQGPKLPPLLNGYTLDGAKVEITGDAKVYEVPSETDTAMTSVGQERKEFRIELPVTVIDPNAKGEFQGVGMWSKIVLAVDKLTGDVTSANRVDRRFDEKGQTYNYDGPTYQIHTPEVEELLKTKAVSEAIKNIRE